VSSVAIPLADFLFVGALPREYIDYLLRKG
jgi:hypothetical protein